MKPIAALELLGSKRVIWIDDQFGQDTVEKLAKLLGDHLEISRTLELEDFEPIFVRIDDEDQEARIDLIEMLKETDPAKRTEIARRFHAKSVEANQDVPDLNSEQIKCVQEQLNINAADSWPFDEAERMMTAQIRSADGDSHITYIVDLEDAYGAKGNERGLDLLKVLSKSNSKATAFLLTRNATRDSEARLEDELRAKLMDPGDPSSEAPICVIAKERLEGGKSVIEDGLRVAIKRAGLRRGIHEVLLRANTEVTKAFNEARARLLKVPPEELDHYVVERAYKEGVSELHVVERALSASMSQSFKLLFATDPQAIEGAARLRNLRPIKLDPPKVASSDLEAFRKMELWEDTSLVNRSFSLLACGDVFVVDSKDAVATEPAPAERFVLLVQPCDVMLRHDGSRDFDTGMLVQITPKDPEDKSAGGLKTPVLPFLLEGREWICQFRKAATVKLAVLDAATWNGDGRVEYAHDGKNSFPSALLPGQLKNAKRIAALHEEALSQRAKIAAGDPIWFAPQCLLTLSSTKGFERFAAPAFTSKAIPGKKGQPDTLTGSFSWGLRRLGRVRMPYAAALLSNYLAVQGREAFDLDYLKTGGQSCSVECQPGEAAEAADHAKQFELPLTGASADALTHAAAQVPTGGFWTRLWRRMFGNKTAS